MTEVDELLTALGLDPNTYRTDGGWLNIPKILAAIKNPEDYPHLEHVLDGKECWCNPDIDYVDPETGVAVIVHREPIQPARREWVGLTETERNEIEERCEILIGKPAFDSIEAKLKERNT